LWSRDDGRRLGDRGRIRGCLGLGSGGRAGFGARERLLRLAQLALQSAQLGPEDGTPIVRHVDQIVVDTPLASLTHVGFESPADVIDATDQVDVQAVEVVAGSVAHLEWVLGSSSVGCSLPERASRGQKAKAQSPSEEDVRFASACDIEFAISEFADPSGSSLHWAAPRSSTTIRQHPYAQSGGDRQPEDSTP
jgi:hypothetical protein